MAVDRRKQPASTAGGESTPGRASADSDDASVDVLDEDESGADEYEDDDEDEDEDSEVIIGEVVDDDDFDNIDDQLDAIASGPSKGDGKKKDVKTKLVKRDPLNAYVQETKRFPLLPREVEHELAVRVVEDGDTAAARRLIESNLRLVVKIAYEYRRAHRNLLDLIQEGNIGLMNAVRKYDPYRGVKLSSYAAWWIRAYILKFVLNNWRMVKIGTTQAQRKLFFNLRKEKERLEQLGFQPTPALLAENLDVQEREVIEMEKRMSAPDASLDAPVGTDEDGAPKTRLDYLFDDDEVRPDLQVASNEVQDLLKSKLDAFGDMLEGRDATIFRDRMLSDSPLTLQQIGDQYSISRERARQLEKRLLKKLRQFLERELGAAVDIAAMMRE